MRSIERRFKKISKRNPYWSSLISFAQAITGQKFKRRAIYSQFDKLVEKDDYVPKEKCAILKNLAEAEPP